MTLDLPDDLARRVKLLAVHQDQKLKDMVADLLRRGLSAGLATLVKADKGKLKLRKGLTRKFVSGEWGVELAGLEEARAVDRRKAEQRDQAWRE